MPTDRGGLKAAFAQFKKPDSETDAELKLLGRAAEPAPDNLPTEQPSSYPVATSIADVESSNQLKSGLTPRPLLHREPVRQLSFRCPISVAGELRKKAAFNQLEQQEIIIEGLKRVLAELPTPPGSWEDA